MKKASYIILGILIIAFVGTQIFTLKAQKNIEEYSYDVNKKYHNFEIRTYETTLFALVQLSENNYKETSGKGFRMLAGYIFGENERGQKIAMTSPVTMSLEDSVTMMFMVPKKFDEESLPTPTNKQIEFKEEPQKIVAAIAFGGWANDEKIEQYKQKLIKALEKEGIAHTGRFQFLGYNPPFEVFNRRNEVIVELAEE